MMVRMSSLPLPPHAAPPPTSPPAAWTPPAPPPARFESPRFTIRVYEPADAPALFHAIDAFRESYLPWLPWAKSQHRTVADSAATIDRFRASAAAPLDPLNNAVFGYVYGVFEKSTGQLVAGAGFNRLAPEWRNAETGYWVRGDRRRQGIAVEVLAATLTTGFTDQSQGGFGFRRVHLFAARANIASCAVPAKLGLRAMMHAREDRWLDGPGWCDSLGWDVLASEWDIARSTLRPGPSPCA